ncbi:hypothetical protein [Leptospira ilyithenensis]|uniref:Uncharacterized protein n=1 Tax=Leptospira ilyithenensis TaxID=2484901 RepID=A0A4R9LV47_9LEPT|nr:hypothetical protein [Leptospira ilyithenensis]TGN14379.1 hypothetical protein EHS11_01710 [Leptospira ilyithenensis]
MAGTIKVALELADAIKKENLEGKDKIPTSETFLRIWAGHFSRSEEEIRKVLSSLKESHYIFIINIVAPDPNLFVYGEEAYLCADISILNDLKKSAEDTLEKLYESSNYKRKSAFQITRELFPKIKEYNNTPLGRSINLVVMLEEYSRILNTANFEYTDQWKRNQLQEVYRDEMNAVDEMAPFLNAREQEAGKRAVDQIREAPKEKVDQNWVKATQAFSVEFLVRVHFRKYEFDVIKKLIQSGKLKEEKDIKLVRDTLQVMEGRTGQDRLLKRYEADMIELRRYCQAKLNMMRQGIIQKTNP